MLTKDSLPSEITVEDVLTHPIMHIPKTQKLSSDKPLDQQIKEKQRTLKLLKKAYDRDVYDDPAERLGFLPSFFAQFSLPHVEPEYDDIKFGNPNYQIVAKGFHSVVFPDFSWLTFAERLEKRDHQ